MPLQPAPVQVHLAVGIGRACAYRDSVGRPARYVRAEDRIVTAQIRTVIRTRSSYGARRVRALVHPAFATGYNLKRSDNGSIYTALDTLCTAERLHLVPITTPASSPQSNSMSEAFVNTLRRDYLAGADFSTAGRVMAQIPAWIADYNAVAPHSALGFQSPQQYRSSRSTVGLTC
jgi:hypothetical protein